MEELIISHTIIPANKFRNDAYIDYIIAEEKARTIYAYERDENKVIEFVCFDFEYHGGRLGLVLNTYYRQFSYIDAARQIIKELFCFAMDADTWKEFETELLRGGLDYNKLAQDIETGVNNGHSLEEQKQIIKQLFK